LRRLFRTQRKDSLALVRIKVMAIVADTCEQKPILRGMWLGSDLGQISLIDYWGPRGLKGDYGKALANGVAGRSFSGDHPGKRRPRYLPMHLNPVRVMRLGLGKGRQKSAKMGLAPVREGLPETPWERLIGGTILGTETFAKAVMERIKGNRREQAGVKQMERRHEWEEIVAAAERVNGAKWMQFRDQHGDWGRDAALWFGRRAGRLRLRELGHLAGGIDYGAAGAAVARFSRRLPKEPGLRKLAGKIEAELLNIEI
jgi:hypothetical protein